MTPTGVLNGAASIGTLTLATTSYTDTFTGTNTLSGTVNLNTGATLNTTTIQRGATATPTAGTITVTSQINWNDGAIGNIAGGDLGISGITLVSNGAAANHTFNISGAQTATVSSVISGAGPITKSGTGTLIYSGVNTLTGGTTVGGGTLLASNAVSGSNSATGTGAVTVNGANGGGILGGTGSIAGALTITTTSGTPGTLRPGDASANGTLAVLAGMTVNSGARLGFHIQSAGLPAAADTGGSTEGTVPNPTSNNFLNITGGTTSIRSGTVLALDGTGATFAPFTSYSYQVGQGAGAQNLSINAPSQFVFTNFNLSPDSATFTANGAGNLYVNLTYVPEPATLGLLGFAAAALLGRRSRSHRRRDGSGTATA